MTTYIGSGTGYNTYVGTGTNNTLDYSQDPNSVVVDLATGAVLKDFVSPFFIRGQFLRHPEFCGQRRRQHHVRKHRHGQLHLHRPGQQQHARLLQ